MAFTPIETIALIVVIVSVIKMIVLLVNPKSWMNFAKGIYAKPRLVQVVALVLGAIVLYYLVLGGVTIVEIMAVTAFVSLLVLVGLAKEVGPLMKKYEAMIKKGNLWKEYWLYALIWIVLILWAARELLL